MKLFFEFLALVALVLTFRTVRVQRMINEITNRATLKAQRDAEIESRAWRRADPADTREVRRLRVVNEDAPSYTTYTETGSFKKIETGTFKNLP